MTKKRIPMPISFFPSMRFKLEDAHIVNLPGFDAFLYNSKSEFPPCSMVFVDCHSSHARVMVKASHRIYFVIEGEGGFVLEGRRYDVSQHDVIVIKPQTAYEYSGRMKLFEVNFPATDASDEVALDPQE